MKPPTAPSQSHSWEAALKMLGAYTTVESFFGTFATLRRPSQLEKNSNYHLFKDGIKPMWEDRRNAQGGKWTLTFKANQNPALLDRSWMWLVLALIGEELDPDDLLTGAVCSLRPKGDRLSLWTRTRSGADAPRLNALARRLLALLDLEAEPGIVLEFNSQTGKPLQQPNGFWHFHSGAGGASGSRTGGAAGGGGQQHGNSRHQNQHQQGQQQQQQVPAGHAPHAPLTTDKPGGGHSLSGGSKPTSVPAGGSGRRSIFSASGMGASGSGLGLGLGLSVGSGGSSLGSSPTKSNNGGRVSPGVGGGAGASGGLLGRSPRPSGAHCSPRSQSPGR